MTSVISVMYTLYPDRRHQSTGVHDHGSSHRWLSGYKASPCKTNADVRGETGSHGSEGFHYDALRVLPTFQARAQYFQGDQTWMRHEAALGASVGVGGVEVSRAWKPSSIVHRELEPRSCPTCFRTPKTPTVSHLTTGRKQDVVIQQ